MSSGQEPPGGKPEPGLSTTPPDEPPYVRRASSEIKREWRPEPGAGQLIGTALASVGLLLTLLSAQLAGSAEGAGRIIWALLALVTISGTSLIVFFLIRLRSIRYVIKEAALVVSAAGRRFEIPFREIIAVDFRPRDVIEMGGYERLWPGFYDSWALTSEGYWRSLATTPPHERVRIRTSSGAIVAISPERPVLFVDALEAARHRPPPAPHSRSRDDDGPPTPAGLPVVPHHAFAPTVGAQRRRPIRAPMQLPELPMPLAYRIFRQRVVREDPVASRLLALSLLVLITLVFLAAWKVDAVTRPLAVKWNPDGEPSWFVRPDGFWLVDGVWIYPATVAAIIAINAALATLAAAFERTREARLLLSAAFVAGCIVLVAMVRTTGLF